MHSVIIGGTRGLGREVVRHFSDQGHTVSVVGQREPSHQDCILSGVHFWATDLTNEQTLFTILDEIVSRHGPVNYLVLLQRFKGQDNPWGGEIATTLTATKNVIDQLSSHFCKNGDKSIVLVSSIASEFISGGQPLAYHMSKAALRQMSRYYAVELGQRGIRVNTVSPCTFIKEENEAFYTEKKDLNNLFQRTIPLGRMGTARESANVIAFLCSSKASFVTGQEIFVDGGVSLLSQESLARKLTEL